MPSLISPACSYPKHLRSTAARNRPRSLNEESLLRNLERPGPGKKQPQASPLHEQMWCPSCVILIAVQLRSHKARIHPSDYKVLPMLHRMPAHHDNHLLALLVYLMLFT